MNKDKVGRYLCYILRHDPASVGLKADKRGYVRVDELLKGISGRYKITKEMLEEIVATDSKQRYSFSEDKRYIRCNQGHSFEVDLGLKAQEPPFVLYHGTAWKNVGLINKQGLLKMSRQYVHLSKDIETAKVVGARHGNPVVYTVDSQSMYADGYKFYLADNGVWLTDNVPPKYLTIK